MIKSYNYHEWNNNKRTDDVQNGDTFAACCGSRYYEKPTRLCNAKGIALYPNKKFREGEHQFNTVKHVDTPDGVITIVTRTVW